jgi:hypothetical protein
MGISLAQEQPALTGWGRNSEYNQHYDSGENDQFKGTVVKIHSITPLPGMAPGIGLTVRDQDGDIVHVQLGPKAFVDLDSIGLKKGDKVKVRGAWAQIGGNDVFMASKVKKGEDIELKLRRTQDGVPYWNLSPDELSNEKAKQ